MQKAVDIFEREFVKSTKNSLIDTLSQSMLNLHKYFDDFVGNINQKSEIIQRDLVEPLELYYKHYNSTNSELLRQGTQFWNQLHQERQQMVFAKEIYWNHMHQLTQLQQQY